MPQSDMTSITIKRKVKERLKKLREDPTTPKECSTSWSALLNAMIDKCEEDDSN